MTQEQSQGTCEHCGRPFGYRLVHSGFGDSLYGYCVRCGKTAILGRLMPRRLGMESCGAGPLPAGSEMKLRPCSCCGRFSGQASPRCPHCGEELSAELAAAYIEGNVRAGKGRWRKRWRWQRSWGQVYCIVIEERIVKDPW